MTDVTGGTAAEQLRRLFAAQPALVRALVPQQPQSQPPATQASTDARLAYYNEYLHILMKNASIQQQQLPNNNLLVGRMLAEQQQQQSLCHLTATVDVFRAVGERFDSWLQFQRQSASSQSLLFAAGTERSMCQEGTSSSASSPESSSLSPLAVGNPLITVPEMTTISLFGNNNKNNQTDNTSPIVGIMDYGRSTTSGSGYGSDSVVDTVAEPGPNNGELLVPSNDKEGWCRNKKYIQIVKKGYRCTVCNKVYGRYNSVSYHVTIYHRNPPIRCEQNGCQFTTREARYIHFHKYYRHQIPLPESIDLASRKCPLVRCKHVSKSPAMLEKHLQRHVVDCLRDGGVYECAECAAAAGGTTAAFQALSYEAMFDHLRAVHTPTGKMPPVPPVPAFTPPPDKEPIDEPMDVAPRSNENEPCSKKQSAKSPPAYICSLCPYRGQTASNLEQHNLTKHSNVTTIPAAIKEEPIKCISDIASPIVIKSLPPAPWSTPTVRLEDLTNYANIARQQEQQRQQLQRLYELQLLQASKQQAQAQATFGAALGGVASPENFMRAFEQLLTVQKALFANSPS